MAKRKRQWEKYPKLEHLEGLQREQMETRRRHRGVRYVLFRLKKVMDEDLPLEGVQLLPGFLDFWLNQVPEYQVNPKGERVDVPAHLKGRPVGDMGGYPNFAILWDVDPDLNVYLRHSSVWQEWNALMMRVVPILGEH